MEREIIWNKRLSSFANVLIHISEDSFQNAEIIENAVLSAIEDIKDRPEKYPPDKYKSNNKGDFRAFETHSYRVAYRFNDKEYPHFKNPSRQTRT